MRRPAACALLASRGAQLVEAPNTPASYRSPGAVLAASAATTTSAAAASAAASAASSHTSAPTDTLSAALSGTAAVRARLTEIGLGQYADRLEEEGFDDLPFLRRLDKEKLERLALDPAVLGMRRGHAMKFCREI